MGPKNNPSASSSNSHSSRVHGAASKLPLISDWESDCLAALLSALPSTLASVEIQEEEAGQKEAKARQRNKRQRKKRQQQESKQGVRQRQEAEQEDVRLLTCVYMRAVAEVAARAAEREAANKLEGLKLLNSVYERVVAELVDRASRERMQERQQKKRQRRQAKWNMSRVHTAASEFRVEFEVRGTFFCEAGSFRPRFCSEPWSWSPP